MTTIAASFYRDANRVPITEDGLITAAPQVLSGSNTTVATPVFRITGSVEIRGLWGEVTTVLGSNVTAAFYRLNDQTAQPDITLATGTTLSSAAVGSMLVKKGLAAAAVTLLTSAAGRVSEPTTLETTYFSPFVVVKKTGATTDIEFVYTTTNTPTSGAILHFIRWLPLSSDANVVVV